MSRVPGSSHRPRHRAAVLLATAALLAPAACGPFDSGGDGNPDGASPPVRSGGELRVALAAEPGTLDPTLARSPAARVVLHTICERLYDVDADLNLVPELAAALPEVAGDGLRMTLPVRRGVTFADGTALDAGAVKASLDRHRQLPGSARAADLASVERITVVDEFTVRLVLDAPFAPLPSVLAGLAGTIMSPTALAEAGEFGAAPVCAGPFRFSGSVAGDRIEVVEDPAYYRADEIHLDRITYRIIPAARVRLERLRSGEVEVLTGVAPADAAALESEPGLALRSSGSLGYQGITVNVGNADGVGAPPAALPEEYASPLSRSAAVRRALDLALDREAINEVVSGGRFAPACGPISPASPLSPDRGRDCPEADPLSARNLLGEAGVRLPVPVELVIGTDDRARRLGEAIRAQAAGAGFDVRLRPTEPSSARELAESGRYQLVQLGWSGRLDPDGNIARFLATGAPRNVAGYHHPRADELIAAARATTDVAQRRQRYGELMEIVRRDAPIIYLYRRQHLTGVADTVTGVQAYGDGVVRLARAGFVDRAAAG